LISGQCPLFQCLPMLQMHLGKIPGHHAFTMHKCENWKPEREGLSIQYENILLFGSINIWPILKVIEEIAKRVFWSSFLLLAASKTVLATFAGKKPTCNLRTSLLSIPCVTWELIVCQTLFSLLICMTQYFSDSKVQYKNTRKSQTRKTTAWWHVLQPENQFTRSWTTPGINQKLKQEHFFDWNPSSKEAVPIYGHTKLILQSRIPSN
jgi:hypothetical protein